MKKFFCVVSHTHWDREWYKPFECFRMQLCDLINNLFEIIEQYPDYIFHLDAQTVVLEDYLEIYPENRIILEKYIKSKNIIVGPWYLQNDYYLTSGESTIRNLLVGTDLAEKFGACGKSGYSPDQFGNISQLPQILNNFGIDNFVFGRGFAPYITTEKGEKQLINTPCEFTWCGADGSKVFAIHLKYWYNNAQRFSADTEKALLLIREAEERFEGATLSPYLLLMNGVDHLEAQEDLFPILNTLNSENINGEIKQVLMSDYINTVRNYIENFKKELPCFSGELRQGGDSSILQGTLSSRHYLKIENVKAQILLENYLEPLYSMLELSGFENIYPKNYMRYLWKLLMQNQPHDSICGCSRDEIHRHMEDRYERINELAETLIINGIKTAAYHNAIAASDKNAYSLTIANTAGNSFSGTIKAILRFPAKEEVDNFFITDENGNETEFGLIVRKKEMFDFFSPINLPGRQAVDTFEIYLPVKCIDPMSFVFYKVTPCKGSLTAMENSNESILENEFLKVTVNKNGRIDILCKQNNREIKNCIYFEDRADKGDSYNFVSAEDEPITNDSFTPDIKILESNKYRQVCSVSYNFLLPESFDFENNKRSSKTKISVCELVLSLEMHSQRLDIDFNISNNSRDHRLRLFVNSDVTSKKFIADIPFDIITRRDEDTHPEMIDVCYPNTSFAALENKEKGLAVFTKGTHEVTKKGDNTLGFTLVRSTGCIVHGTGSQWICPENQCLRDIKGSLAIYPYQPEKASCLHAESIAFRTPPLCCCVPCDTSKLSGGRPAVQDSNISEIFYRNDPYSHISLKSKSLLNIESNLVVVSAFKLAEDGKGIILRLFNPTEDVISTEIKIRGDIYASDMSEKTGNSLGKNSITVNIHPKKIITLRVVN